MDATLPSAAPDHRPARGQRVAWHDTDEPDLLVSMRQDGSYFRAVDQVIVPEPGLSAMTTAIRELVRSGEIAGVGVRCGDPA